MGHGIHMDEAEWKAIKKAADRSELACQDIREFLRGTAYRGYTFSCDVSPNLMNGHPFIARELVKNYRNEAQIVLKIKGHRKGPFHNIIVIEDELANDLAALEMFIITTLIKNIRRMESEDKNG